MWDATLSHPPLVSSDSRLLRGGLLRRWIGTDGHVSQPPLDHHYLVVHLGGAKRVRRHGEGGVLDKDLEPGWMSVVPAGSAFDWFTEGPIDFLRLYIRPDRIGRAVMEGFDREPGAVGLQDQVGLNDRLLECLVLTMLEEIARPDPPPKLYLEGLFDAALLRLVRLATDVSHVPTGVRQPLAPHRLRRVKAYIEEHLAEDLDVQALADVAGLSRFHFSHAFQQTTGVSPYLYVTRARIAHAKAALSQTTLPISRIAKASGFNSAGQFSSTFKKLTGASPREWRANR